MNTTLLITFASGVIVGFLIAYAIRKSQQKLLVEIQEKLNTLTKKVDDQTKITNEFSKSCENAIISLQNKRI